MKKHDPEKMKARADGATRPAPEAAPEPGPTAASPGPAGGAQEPGAAAGIQGGSPEEVPELTPEAYRELLRKAGERDIYRNELLREKADFANYQKRILRDRPALEAMAVRRFALDLLPVLDTFHRALEREDTPPEALQEGIRIVRKMLQEALSRHGIEEIEALGKPFDPSFHEAVSTEETASSPPESVSEVLERGYICKGQVLRPAKVKVAKAPAGAAPSPPPGGEGGSGAASDDGRV